MSGNAYVFSLEPDGHLPLNPDTATLRYRRMATSLGIDTTLKNLRHYTATELISSGVDVRTVAGRLGHGGGGATTLRVYAAWSSEADQRAARTVSGRMPARPQRGSDPRPSTGVVALLVDRETASSYLRIADDLRGAIESGILHAGDPVPTTKTSATRYGVTASTAHRAIMALVEQGLCVASRGRRTTVVDPVAALKEQCGATPAGSAQAPFVSLALTNN